MASRTTPLWRPVGQAERDLIAASGWRRFPPRLPDQPIFYPVCNETYAREIAERWNARDGGKGYVLRFEVRSDFMQRFETHIVGSRTHEEYWIPAGDLESLNDAIVGLVEVAAEFGE